MPDNLSDLSKSATQEINKCSSTTELDSLRVKYLGKKGVVTVALKSVSSIDPKDRPAYGKKINELKSLIQGTLSQKRASLQKKEINQSIDDKKIDVSLPGRSNFGGPVSYTHLTLPTKA